MERAPQPQPPQKQQPTLADLGEWELIRRLGAFAPPGQFSDDAALLAEAVAGQGSLVVNTDVLVEGLHFSDPTTGPVDVGWRAAAANLSDLAAMGCTEVVGLTVGLVAPADTLWSWVEGVYDGLAAALGCYGGELLGGDCSGGAQRMLAVTAIGRLPAPPATVWTLQAEEVARTNTGSRPWGVIRRSDGRPGDALICTGPHGLSRLGLALLQGQLPREEQLPDPGLRERAIAAHRRPVPRFDAVRALIGCRPDGIAWRVGGCDSSDGLAAAVGAIAAASGCTAVLNRTSLPMDPAMTALPRAQDWCLNGGEDFELVLALEPGWAETFLAASPGSRQIGALVAGSAGSLGWSDGGAWPGDGEAAGAGYQHFR
ncbi:thiamine-monophosphate kinase [Synechococcus sp. CBW1004]|uniref:thiamine-phosphate kinase n=1 Tax=Synechococcus sp. CBW1004 TaxID=1353136 RepID=UPI0018CE0483|nr:thiamine-phosphate kinase [Synechococcus sp. CBW1004]QPN62400.1 thiamine-monophosphate kinase [Synechococcus sp. CBW1004]